MGARSSVTKQPFLASHPIHSRNSATARRIGSGATANTKRIQPLPEAVDIRLVVLQRGWVMVGEFSRDGDMCRLTRAACVRIWGTTRGLGQIASDGPTRKTKLDKCPDVQFHILTSIMTIQCDSEKWKDVL